MHREGALARNASAANNWKLGHSAWNRKELLFLTWRGESRWAAQSQCSSSVWPSRSQAFSIHSSTLPRWVLAFMPTRVASSSQDDDSSATSFPPLSQEERHPESKIFPMYPWPRTEFQAHSCCKGVGASHRSPLYIQAGFCWRGRKGNKYGSKQIFLVQKGSGSVWPGRVSPGRGVDFLFI